MSASTTQESAPLVCPRCRSNTTEVRAVSPKPAVWTVYGCNTCFYTWRSTEPEENTIRTSIRRCFGWRRRTCQNSRWRHRSRRFGQRNLKANFVRKRGDGRKRGDRQDDHL